MDVLEVQGVIVKRCTLPDCGSFTIAQGVGGEAPVPPIEGQPVAVRGISASTFGSSGVYLFTVFTLPLRFIIHV